MATAPTDLDAAAILDALTYVRAIQVMAMLLIGFGFLMVFVRQYGRSAITATFLLVSLAIPLYYSKEALGIPLDGHNSLIERLVLSEFAAASLLIAAGAVLGRLTMIQYLLLGGLFLPFYVLDEWVLSQGGLGLLPAGLFVDTGGSILIHAFGALFGVAAAVALTRGHEQEIAIESDETSDRFSLLGSMVLWVFWPSFCAALVPAAAIPATAVNVILALCASTLATYGASLLLRGKILPADIANAALAGGVAIGSTCDRVPPLQAFLIGLAAGLLSTFGYALVQERLQKLLRLVDTCGVLYLHGLPGLLGGLAALVGVADVDAGTQLGGIAIAITLAVASGLLVGRLVALTGQRSYPYSDAEEFLVE